MSEQLETAQENLAALAENPYPGRGIVIGLNEAGDTALQAYWVMGSSENSRNRILVEEDGVVRTEAHDPSKVTDPSLIIYNAMRIMDRKWHVVSNGHQTDAIIDDGWKKGKSFEKILKDWKYEPDGPNYTPRISGVLDVYFERGSQAGGFALYDISVIRKDSESDDPIHSIEVGALRPTKEDGTGKCVHTYLGDGRHCHHLIKSRTTCRLAQG